MKKIPFLIIAGMHRSGTSFLARSLNLAGVYLGNLESLTSNDWRFYFDNERGHWENKKFLFLTTKTLSKNNGSWDNLPEKIIINKKLGKEILQAVDELVNHDSLAAGFKDPRIIPCLESWIKYLPKNIILIGIFRHPLKVAESLKKRDGFSYEKSLKLWKTYNEKLLVHLQKHDGFLIDFDWPKKKLLSELGFIIKKIGLYPNVELESWYTKKILKADKTFNSDYPLNKEIRIIYSNLKKRSEKNNTVKVKKFKMTSKELEAIIKNLLNENKNQGEYFRILNQENLNLIKNIQKKHKPISALISIYSKRPDLREAYPEVVNGDYSRLVDWAIFVVQRKIKDIENDNKLLSKFLPQYHEFLKSSRVYQLERKIHEYNENYMEQTNKIKFLEQENKKLEQEISLHKSELDTLTNSVPYKISRDIITYLDEKIPPNTKRGRFLRKIAYNRYKKAFETISTDRESALSYDYHFDDTLDPQTCTHLINVFNHKPKISIIMPVYDPEISFLRKAIQSVKNQYYTNWQLCICDDGSTKQEIHKILTEESSDDDRISLTFSSKNEGISSASNKAINLATGEFTLLLDNDDELAKNALLEVVKTLNETKNLDFIYSDEDKLNENENHVQPFFKPDWSPDLFFSNNFPIHISVFRTSLLKEIGGFRKGFEGSQDYDLILRYLEKTQRIFHIPKVLYSWRKNPGSTASGPFEKDYAYAAGIRALNEALKRRKIDAHCEGGIQMGTYRIKYRIQNDPLVSIIIPSKSLKYLYGCIKSILTKSTYRKFEILVMDSSKENEIKNFCKQHDEVSCVSVSLDRFNFSKVNNEGVRKSNGEYIIFLNDDTVVINPDWIEGLLEHAQRKEVGIVGAKLLFRDDQVQHAGTIVGIHRHAGNYGGMHKNEGGYFSFAKIIRNTSAVTAACMMIKKETFTEIGGFDENMANSWQDVDLCIRVLNSGKLIVYTPYSVLYHYEGGTRGSTDTSEAELEARKIFREKHKDFIKKGDPYYNPNLSLVVPYQITKNHSRPPS